MPLRYLLDENLRGPLWSAMISANARSPRPLEIIRIGDAADLPLGRSDPEILLWAERHGYVLVSADLRTIPRHLDDHLERGGHTPGVFLVGLPCVIPELVEWRFLLADEPDEDQWRDRITYLP